MADPGVAFRSTTLTGALGLLAAPLGVRGEAVVHEFADEAVAVEEAATSLGLRSRRVLLDGRWWAEGGTPMLARVAERRQMPRESDAAAVSGATGWVALVPLPLAGYRLVAVDPAGGPPLEWPVDEDTARRLAPFAFAFHRSFEPRPLGTVDVLRFALAHARGEVGVLVATGLAAALAGLLTPVATGRLIDRAIPAGSASLAIAIVAGLAAAGLTAIALDVLRTLAVLRFESRTSVAMQAAVLDRVIGAPARFFRAFSSGDLALRLGAVNTVQRTITGASIGAFVTAIFLSANAALMLAYSPKLTAAALGVVAVAAILSAALGAARLSIGRRIEAADGKLSAMAFEYFSGIAKLRAAAAESRAYANWLSRYREFRDLNHRSASLSNLESVLLAILQPAAAILVLYLAWQLAQAPAARALSVGEFVAFQTAMFGLLGGVHGMVATAIDLAALAPVWERARPILATPPEDSVRGKIRHEPQGAIDFVGVSFAYPGGPEVLSGIDLSIRPGEFVAIVGASGSGKSTLLRLLLGFEFPGSGTVRFDGRVLPALDLKCLRARIGTVLQGGRLWAGDILTNIVGASSLTVDDAWDAARAAGLAADIEAMPMGMYTLVGEGVSTLSGGQRQRVLIARALVGRPRILLLDEATSALDNLSQAAVLETLEGLEATRVVIAHRLATVRNADRIVVLDRGRIVQAGTFRELAAVPGPFAAMLARQVA
ncbi:MAG: NHLP bacteriocin export ABC transporter permease/ATPase subunit [Betaproteobacteria bacterium]|nr:MAG: NHLP bacteriocin export ABC transporter permease/ATPase subunit [Betaproteobacteria bacterium]